MDLIRSLCTPPTKNFELGAHQNGPSFCKGGDETCGATVADPAGEKSLFIPLFPVAVVCDFPAWEITGAKMRGYHGEPCTVALGTALELTHPALGPRRFSSSDSDLWTGLSRSTLLLSWDHTTFSAMRAVALPFVGGEEGSESCSNVCSKQDHPSRTKSQAPGFPGGVASGLLDQICSLEYRPLSAFESERRSQETASCVHTCSRCAAACCCSSAH